ncbi:MAG: hypothetical protein COZ56_21385, partial [Armatimonadetes bacterium CG_4_8_14_3_um_filter_58_9]
MTTTHLKLPELTASQSQKHVTVNEALFSLDIVVQLSVIDKDLTSPPVSPVLGDRYIVGPAATGSWTGKSSQVTAYDGSGWIFMTPINGWFCWVEDEKDIYVYDTTWGTFGSSLVAIQNLSLLGVNTTADITNKLAVASEAVLFTNTGNNVQLKLNKATPGDTASLLFQSGWSGRAEMGLAGNDDFSVKVS